MDYLNASAGVRSSGRSVELFEAWLADAFAARDQGELAEPNAMVVATSVADRPTPGPCC